MRPSIDLFILISDFFFCISHIKQIVNIDLHDLTEDIFEYNLLYLNTKNLNLLVFSWKK